jgi:calcineurin-like phosphoesterase family protein
MNIFFSSDHHFDHDRIINYCNRPFRYVEEMNERLIHNWNVRVKPDDEVYYLGDFGLRGPEQLLPFRRRMNGNWKIFVAGNHDRKTVLSDGELADKIIKFSPTTFHLLKLDNINFSLSHCPLNIIPGTTINLFGHTHQPNALQSSNSINIGVDAWNMFPVELSEIKNLIKP